MKLAIISLDLMISLPIISAAIALLFLNIADSQNQLVSFANAQNRSLQAMVTSQQLAQIFDKAQNYSIALNESQPVAEQNKLAFKISNQTAFGECNPNLTICRLVALSGLTKLLVVSYENAS